MFTAPYSVTGTDPPIASKVLIRRDRTKSWWHQKLNFQNISLTSSMLNLYLKM